MADERRDYYELLGVPRDADAKRLKEAFRRLALEYHPDRNKSPEATTRFKQIAEAYAVLSDPERRAAYDTRGFAGVSGLEPEDVFAHMGLDDLFGGFDVAGSLFERLFGRARKQRQAEASVELQIPLERVLEGGEEKLRFSRKAPCKTCGGSGARPGTKPRPCGSCVGTGRQTLSTRRGDVEVRSITDCQSCGGRGELIDEPCEDCHGRKRIDEPAELSVRIPPGVEEGTALRLQGQASALGAELTGDLLVVVHSAPDARFARRGADLWSTLELDVVDAVLGKRMEVSIVGGKASVFIPPGSQPGDVLRLRGKGLPRPDSRAHGDLHLELSVTIPAHPSEEESRLWEQIRQLRERVG